MRLTKSVQTTEPRACRFAALGFPFISLQAARRSRALCLTWDVSSFADVRVSLTISTLLILIGVGCGPSQEARMLSYELREVKCIQIYSSGDIQAARQSLLDYLHLIEEKESSGLPFRKTAYSKALTFARLTLISRHLGEKGLADQYFQTTVAHAKKDAQEEQNKDWLNKNDEQLGNLMLELVTKLDEMNLHPKWRSK